MASTFTNTVLSYNTGTLCMLFDVKPTSTEQDSFVDNNAKTVRINDFTISVILILWLCVYFVPFSLVLFFFFFFFFFFLLLLLLFFVLLLILLLFFVLLLLFVLFVCLFFVLFFVFVFFFFSSV